MVTSKKSNKTKTAKELTGKATLGGYGYKAAAEQECNNFKAPNVFQYQSGLFPNPQNHGVTVKITSAIPVELKEPTTPLYPWGVELKLKIAGATIEKCQSWYKKFKARIRTKVI